MDKARRRFLAGTAVAGLGLCAGISTRPQLLSNPLHACTGSHTPSTYAVIPVVNDGRYIIGDPPKDTRGYFYPREFDVTVGMSFTGNGNSSQLIATTAAPVPFPEQEILEFEIETKGCQAEIIALSDTAAQLALSAPVLRGGQTVSALARYRMRVSMAYQGYDQDRFPADQSKVTRVFPKRFLRNSSGIKCNTATVKALVRELVTDKTHPWEAAQIFQQWVWKEIEGVPGNYTSVDAAIKKRTGDCEERATVFIALCRAAGIPSRLVWVPGHNWAEIGLLDRDGQAHWIPVHTAAYAWFGWTGAHEIVMQKGDNIYIPHRKKKLRLVDDWYRLKGPRPEMVYTATVKPVASGEEKDPGPGQREKRPNGVWELTGDHPRNPYMRDK